MLKSIFKIIPVSYRRRGLWVAITIFLRAILNFVGVALLVPILVLMLSAEGGGELIGWLGGLLSTTNHLYITAFVCLVVIAVVVIKSVLVMVLHRYERNFIFSFYRELSLKLYLGYYRRGLGFIKQNNSSALSRNVNVVSLMFATGVLRPLATMLGDVLLLLFVAVALFVYSPYVALLLCLVFTPIAAIFYLVVRRRIQRIGAEENDVQRHKSRVVSETFRGYSDIEIGGAMPLMVKRFSDDIDAISELRQRHSSLSQLPQFFMEIGLVVGMVLVVLFSITSKSDISLIFGIFAIVAIRLIPSVRSILTQWSLIRYNRYTIDELLKVDITNVNTDVDQCNERMTLKNAIKLDGVSFKFDDAQEPILSNLSLTISRGEYVGIRGASGVGKTTLFNLLLGLYRPSSGKISVDDTTLTDENIRMWQNSIGYVSQNVFIADSTIAENIALGTQKQSIDYALVAKVISQANLNSFVQSLPQGLDTRIGEQGSRLSGGQRQRIGIARALYKGCDVLLLDEATSSLDNQTEESINQEMLHLKRSNDNLTIVVIAHRDSTLENCNRIITLE
jgi:ABC-type bacteriocin/lantibiotic exporter with double-glycine peptidase domain